MKNFLFIFIVVISFSACTELEQLNHINRSETFYGIDFSKYAEKHFLFTPEKYNGDYLSIGLMTYELFPEASYRRTKTKIVYKVDDNGNRYAEDLSTYEWFVEKINVDQAIDSIYNKCIKMNADAFVNFKAERISKSYSGFKNPTSISGIRISGFAIKRK